jgi:TonB-linked SusC/RagA family outer membrane protein
MNQPCGPSVPESCAGRPSRGRARGARRRLAPALAAATFGCALGVCAAPAVAAQPPADVAPRGGVVGVVVDERGRPVADAQVGAQGTAAVTLTGTDGGFRLSDVPGPRATLQLRRIGFRPRAETVDVGGAAVRLVLVEATRVLDEVVVTGTAQPQARRALGNSVTTIDAAATRAVTPTGSATDLLNGRAPGVFVSAGSGAIGAGPRIRTRASSSLRLSDQPLVYVDGVRVANDVATGPTSQGFGSSVVSRLNDLNPDEIDRIEIVKGPAAAALYGTEANNGVIQILTKRGQAGRTALTSDVRQGGSWFANARERIGYTYSRDSVTGAVQRWSAVEQEAARGTPFFRTGHAQQYNVALGGGTPQTRYYVNNGYQRDDGIEPTSGLWRYSGRANLTLAPRANVEVVTSLGTTQQRTALPQEVGGGVWFSAYYGQAPRTAADSARRGFFRAPPEVLWQVNQYRQRVRRTLGSTTVTHRAGGWFDQRLTAGYDDTDEVNTTFTPRLDAFARQFYADLSAQNGNKATVRRALAVASVDYAGTVRARLPRGLASATSGGAQFFRRNTGLLVAAGEGFPAAGLTQVGAAATTVGFESALTNSTLGFYVQEQVSAGDRWYATAALRADDNSAFGSNFSWVRYPKYSLAWVASEEPWWPVAAVRALKLRVAYGETGQQPATASALRTFQPITTGSGASAVTPATAGNPDLRPERGREWEGGVEASLLGQRMTVDLTGYRRMTNDGIVAVPVAPSEGFPGTRLVNLGRLMTRGVEAQVSGTLVERGRFVLQGALNLSRNANRVVDVGGPAFVAEAGSSIQHRVGYPVGSWWSYRVVSAAFNPDGSTRDVRCDDGAGGTTPCLDAAGAVVAPRVFLGRADPPNEGSVSATATVAGRVRLYGLVDWKTGHRQVDGHTGVRCQTLRVCPENLSPLDHDPVRVAQYRSSALRTYAFVDASFARLRELSAAYTLPGPLVRAARARTGTFTVSGRNLGLWTRWTGIDPELFQTVQQFDRTEQAQVPVLQQAVASLNLTF